MLKNDTRFRIELSLNRWDIIEPSTDETVAHASTYDKAVLAAREIESATGKLSQAVIDTRPRGEEPQGLWRRLFWRHRNEVAI